MKEEIPIDRRLAYIFARSYFRESVLKEHEIDPRLAADYIISMHRSMYETFRQTIQNS